MAKTGAVCYPPRMVSGRGLRMWCMGAGIALTLARSVSAGGAGLPDLIIWGPTANPFITTNSFATNSCTVLEGCAVAGQRRLLRFTTESRNIGDADLMIGSPVGNPLFEFDNCHGHYHFRAFAEYRLVNSCGQVAASLKVGFCLTDSSRWNTNANPSSVFSCTFQGIQTGWADIYSSATPCQWIDITGLPAGNYTLQMETNPEQRLVESDYSNNSTNIAVTIPLIDADADGLGDDWEWLHGVTDPNADADADGATNLQEFRANTNPQAAASVFRITDIVSTNGASHAITWAAVGCSRYRVQYSDGGDGGSYTNAFTDIVRPDADEIAAHAYGTPAPMSFTDDFTQTPAPNGVRYYRVRIAP